MAKSDDWSTPPELIKVLDAEFKFTLEVCAAKDNRALPHLPYMGLDNGKDALVDVWGNLGEVCYCNPPYSMLPAFINAAAMNSLTGRTAVLLIPTYTDTKYWQDHIKNYASEVRFLKGRLSFLMNGQKQTTARFPSAVVVFKPYKTVDVPNMVLWDWKTALK